ncbi:MAG: type II toxin-antitoxin system HicB family antitoxin [Paracoccus sp. (in: a-proteobacteria)]
MKSFLALIQKDDDSAYGISFPDLPGCFSAADEERDILSNAAEALELWFEDEPMREPRYLRDIAAEMAEELAAGAFLIAVPYIRRTSRQRRVNVSFDTGTLDAVDMAAKQLGLTRSGFLAMAALNEIKGAH